MKTLVTERIITETRKLSFGYWDEEAEDFVEVSSSEEIALAADKLNTSPEMIQALISLAEIIADRVSDDLTDIWKRLDELENRLSSRTRKA